MQEENEEAQQAMVERLLNDGTSSAGFYAATKTLASASPAAQWSVSDLFVGQSPEIISRKILDFFGGIASSAPEDERFPEILRVNGGLPRFDEESVTKLLR